MQHLLQGRLAFEVLAAQWAREHLGRLAGHGVHVRPSLAPEYRLDHDFRTEWGPGYRGLHASHTQLGGHTGWGVRHAWGQAQQTPTGPPIRGVFYRLFLPRRRRPGRRKHQNRMGDAAQQPRTSAVNGACGRSHRQCWARRTPRREWLVCRAHPAGASAVRTATAKGGARRAPTKLKGARTKKLPG